jgi:hypothetical protein
VFAQPVKVPAEFELQIPKKKIVRRAQVMWYDGHNHGVMFLDEGQGAAGGAPSRVQEAMKKPTSSQKDLSIPEILDDARQQIAQLLGVSVDVIQLKVEIDR